jgi:hypothetical protein
MAARRPNSPSSSPMKPSVGPGWSSSPASSRASSLACYSDRFTQLPFRPGRLPPTFSRSLGTAAAFANTASAKRDYEAVNDVMIRLSINLPMDVAGIGPVKKSLAELNREPCD